MLKKLKIWSCVLWRVEPEILISRLLELSSKHKTKKQTKNINANFLYHI